MLIYTSIFIRKSIIPWRTVSGKKNAINIYCLPTMNVGWGARDLQIHPVWAKASEANDLRWIQIHGDLHRVLGNTEKNTLIFLDNSKTHD